MGRVLRGEVRIPSFQRPLNWKSKDVLDLFDSIYHGFPIGSLLFRKGSAAASEMVLGPLRFFGRETAASLEVIDGQQRLIALAAGLGRSVPIPTTPTDPYVVYFDASMETFVAPPRSGEIPTWWVPLPMLLDSGVLNEWMFTWPHSGDATSRQVVFQAGKRLREYRVPYYVVETDDDDVLRTMFERLNNRGVELSWKDVHDARYGRKGGAPSSLDDLAAQLETLGMGRPGNEEQLLPCLLAFKGLDVTRSLGEYLREDPRILEGVAAAALPAIREAMSFLRSEAEIPHLRLLPYSAPLIVLTAFFRKHPEPNDRTRTLLTRWIWRSFLGAEHDDRALRRRGVGAVSDDEEATAQALLQLVGDRPVEPVIPDAFDARASKSRIVLLAMASLQPRTLDGTPVDVAALIREHDVDAFRPIFPLAGGERRSPANRILLPGQGAAATELRAAIENRMINPLIRHSHGISDEATLAIVSRDEATVLRTRRMVLVAQIGALGERLAEWGHNDRPSIDYLLRLAGGD